MKEKCDTLVHHYSEYAIALFKDCCIRIEGNVENTVDLWNDIQKPLREERIQIHFKTERLIDRTTLATNSCFRKTENEKRLK